MTQRRAIAIGLGVPVVLLVALLSWGVAQNGGVSGRPGVNDSFGTVALSVEPDADFTLIALDGRQISLEQLKGKVVMVDFWSSWCVPCRVEGPLLAETYREWRDRGVEFVGIAIWDERGAVEEFIDRNGIEYANGIDDSGRIAVDWGVRGIPEKFFVNAEGQVVQKVIGPNTEATLDQILTRLTDEAIGIKTPVPPSSP
jgi:cytochrome c biogenesis protein CcmG/thiol:disulfide interchange protein DsbE